MARKPHPADIYEAQQIARASYFTAYYMAGQGAHYSEQFDTLDAAKAGAARITKERGKFGRQACVYAITPEGWTFPVGEGYRTRR